MLLPAPYAALPHATKEHSRAPDIPLDLDLSFLGGDDDFGMLGFDQDFDFGMEFPVPMAV